MHIFNLGLERPFKWRTIIAEVTTPIIGADFLNHFELLVDMKNKRLIDTKTVKKSAGVSETINTEVSDIITISKDHKYASLPKEFAELTRPGTASNLLRHSVRHTITTGERPRRVNLARQQRHLKHAAQFKTKVEQRQQAQQQKQLQQPSVHDIETSNYRSSSEKQETNYESQTTSLSMILKHRIIDHHPKNKQSTSIPNQLSPEISQPAVKVLEASKNSQQPLRATKLYPYRSLQRPSKSASSASTHRPGNTLKCVVSHAALDSPSNTLGPQSSSSSPKFLPPSLPPKNRHKDDQHQLSSSRLSRKSNMQTLPSLKSSSLLRHRQQTSTQSTFDYDRVQNFGHSDEIMKY